MAAQINDLTRLVLVCNPNNPTSTHLTAAEVGAFLERVPPHVLVILDEAYIEFQTVEDPDTSLDLLPDFDNLVILRTFSKAYGLAGLRVGYALGSEEFKAAVDRVRQPFSVNKLAQAAATEALKHQDNVAERASWNAVERLWMEEELRELGLDVADSQANFCWVALGDNEERDVVAALIARRRGGAAGRRAWAATGTCG